MEEKAEKCFLSRRRITGSLYVKHSLEERARNTKIVFRALFLTSGAGEVGDILFCLQQD